MVRPLLKQISQMYEETKQEAHEKLSRWQEKHLLYQNQERQAHEKLVRLEQEMARVQNHWQDEKSHLESFTYRILDESTMPRPQEIAQLEKAEREWMPALHALAKRLDECKQEALSCLETMQRFQQKQKRLQDKAVENIRTWWCLFQDLDLQRQVLLEPNVGGPGSAEVRMLLVATDMTDAQLRHHENEKAMLQQKTNRVEQRLPFLRPESQSQLAGGSTAAASKQEANTMLHQVRHLEDRLQKQIQKRSDLMNQLEELKQCYQTCVQQYNQTGDCSLQLQTCQALQEDMARRLQPQPPRAS